MDELLEQGLRRLRESDPDIHRLLKPRMETVSRLLNMYIEEVELFNPAYSLVKVQDRQELVVKHILDSLGPLGILSRFLQEGGEGPRQIADVGSGAGLPGIPLAICLEAHRFTLIERMGRRAGFLRNVQALLGLGNVAVEEGEMEKAEAGRFDLVTFRAFRPLEPGLVKALFRLLAPQSTPRRDHAALAAYKGRGDKVRVELAGLDALHWELLPVRVPFLEEERHVVMLYP
jgi:16S rRNA (guanine527-N7)-methyltransferase